MQKVMAAKYPGRCSVSGSPIYPGDTIKFDTSTRKAWLCEHDDMGCTLHSVQQQNRDISRTFLM